MKSFREFIAESDFAASTKHLLLGAILKITVGQGFGAKYFDIMKVAHGGFVKLNGFRPEGSYWTGLIGEPFDPTANNIVNSSELFPGLKIGDVIKCDVQLQALPEGAVIKIAGRLEIPDQEAHKHGDEWIQTHGRYKHFHYNGVIPPGLVTWKR